MRHDNFLYYDLRKKVESFVLNSEILLNRLKAMMGPGNKISPKQIDGMVKWVDRLEYILSSMKVLMNRIIPELESELKYEFKNKLLPAIIFLRPSIKGTFLEMKRYFDHIQHKPISAPAWTELISTCESSEGLALIGDAVLDLTVAQSVWKDLNNVGDMTRRRADLVCNENLALLCDEWGLYDNRVHFDPTEPTCLRTLNHVKGSLVEGILGIVYLEGGLAPILSYIPALKMKWRNSHEV